MTARTTQMTTSEVRARAEHARDSLLTSYGASHITEARASELLKYATRLVAEMETVLAS